MKILMTLSFVVLVMVGTGGKLAFSLIPSSWGCVIIDTFTSFVSYLPKSANSF